MNETRVGDHTIVSATLLLGTAFSFLASIIYAVVGYLAPRRGVEGPAARAVIMFAVWWYALAAATFVGGALSLFAAFGVTSVPVHLAGLYVTLVLVCIALLGLLHYLIFLFTGRDVLVPLGAFYLAYYGLLLYFIIDRAPISVEVSRWQVQVVYANELAGPLYTIVIVFLVMPQIGALAYFTLFFRTTEAMLRYRIALVSWSIIAWFGSAFLANITGTARTDGWQIASRLIGFAAALTILAAYAPPSWIRRWLEARRLAPQ